MILLIMVKNMWYTVVFHLTVPDFIGLTKNASVALSSVKKVNCVSNWISLYSLINGLITLYNL